MIDPFIELPQGTVYSVKKGMNMVFINTFSAEEPLTQFLEAVEHITDIHFYITGNKKRASKVLSHEIPSNVTFTGFLPDDQYIGLLRASEAVISLTTRNHTLQRGGCEAFSIGKPLITSDWPYLREVFGEGAVYVSNSTKGIRDGINEMKTSYRAIKEKIAGHCQKRRQSWKSLLTVLQDLATQTKEEKDKH
jgi:glycosyltransferase involved in cell wall biosynthesis